MDRKAVMRKKHKWLIKVAPKDNLTDIMDVEVNAYWDPEHDLTLESVVDAARMETWWNIFSKTGQKVLIIPVSEPILVS